LTGCISPGKPGSGFSGATFDPGTPFWFSYPALSQNQNASVYLIFRTANSSVYHIGVPLLRDATGRWVVTFPFVPSQLLGANTTPRVSVYLNLSPSRSVFLGEAAYGSGPSVSKFALGEITKRWLEFGADLADSYRGVLEVWNSTNQSNADDLQNLAASLRVLENDVNASLAENQTKTNSSPSRAAIRLSDSIFASEFSVIASGQNDTTLSIAQIGGIFQRIFLHGAADDYLIKTGMDVVARNIQWDRSIDKAHPYGVSPFSTTDGNCDPPNPIYGGSWEGLGTCWEGTKRASETTALGLEVGSSLTKSFYDTSAYMAFKDAGRLVESVFKPLALWDSSSDIFAATYVYWRTQRGDSILYDGKPISGETLMNMEAACGTLNLAAAAGPLPSIGKGAAAIGAALTCPDLNRIEFAPNGYRPPNQPNDGSCAETNPTCNNENKGPTQNAGQDQCQNAPCGNQGSNQNPACQPGPQNCNNQAGDQQNQPNGNNQNACQQGDNCQNQNGCQQGDSGCNNQNACQQGDNCQNQNGCQQGDSGCNNQNACQQGNNCQNQNGCQQGDSGCNNQNECQPDGGNSGPGQSPRGSSSSDQSQGCRAGCSDKLASGQSSTCGQNEECNNNGNNNPNSPPCWQFAGQTSGAQWDNLRCSWDGTHYQATTFHVDSLDAFLNITKDGKANAILHLVGVISVTNPPDDCAGPYSGPYHLDLTENQTSANSGWTVTDTKGSMECPLKVVITVGAFDAPTPPGLQVVMSCPNHDPKDGEASMTIQMTEADSKQN
jgi:hypothetical protein